MHATALSFFILLFSATAFAQEQGESSSTEASSRKALLQEMVKQDRGDITAMEASTKEDGSVILGYTSGAVSICNENQPCTEFAGTPSVPVLQIVASRKGASEIIWVSYRQGAIYRCTNSRCSKSVWHETNR
jgi:hypothetical protein